MELATFLAILFIIIGHLNLLLLALPNSTVTESENYAGGSLTQPGPIGSAVQGPSEPQQRQDSEAQQRQEERNYRKYVEEKTNLLLKSVQDTLENYNDELRPSAFGPPVEVRVKLFINGMLSFSEESMSFQLSLDLLQAWEDERLEYEHPDDFTQRAQYLVLNEDLKKKIWTPDTYFYNQEESDDEVKKIPIGYTRLYSSGLVAQNSKLTPTLRCHMSLEYFPMDKQICTIFIGSASFPDTDIAYNWYDAKSVHLSLGYIDAGQDMTLTRYRRRTVVRMLSVRNYTMLACDLLLERSIGYYLIGVYFPSILIVLIAWFAFWLEREASAERMGLGVTCVLTMATLLLSTQSASSKASSLKAIDVYMGVSFGFVFASLLYSTFIGYFLRRQQHREPSLKEPNGFQNSQGSEVEKAHKRKLKITKGITIFELMFRVVFPMAFILFNIVYWVYYLNVSRISHEELWSAPPVYGRLVEEL